MVLERPAATPERIASVSESQPSPTASARAREAPPRVAVVIPCFNDGALAAEAVSSLAPADDVEVVVVDDGSSEAETLSSLAELVRKGVRVIRQENAGLSAARMRGVSATTAPYVFNLDADDLASPGALALMADRLDADQDAAVCYGDYVEFGTSEIARRVPSTIDPYRLAYTNEYPVTALFRRSVLEAVGGWRHLGVGYEDWRLWMTLAESGCNGVHAGAGVVTFRRRLHGERMLDGAKAEHRALYRGLRREHPGLFAELGAHRRASDLSPLRKLLYPLIYGGRRRFRFERRIKAWLDRRGLWTLRA
jgi:glycosyltransferase involved in cell wall biosynthesis